MIPTGAFTLPSTCILLYIAGNHDCLIYSLYLLTLRSRIQSHSHGVFRGHGFVPLLGALHHPCFFYQPVSVRDQALNLGHVELRRLWLAEMLRRIVCV